MAETVSYHWQQAAAFYDKDDPLFQSWFDTFTTNGRAPQAGELFCLPDHAATLETIGRDPDAFYRGVLAEKMTDFLQENGGYLTKEDMASFQPEWVDPIGVDYRGYEVLEIPPNGHGIVALLALQILKQLPETDDDAHRQTTA